LQAAPHSRHGYDIVDPTRISAELGGDAGLDLLSQALAAHEMHLLLDIVPNHMSTHHHNRWWWDVLKNGRSSPYARYFDIDWHPPRQDLHRRVMLPVLGDALDVLLRRDEIRLAGDRGEPMLRYGDQLFPVAPDSLEAGAGPPGAGGLANLLARQHYLLCPWREAARDINYRRFFDINELVGLRAEDETVFADTHRLVLELVADGRVAGLRVDHVDGLRDPSAYLARLREAAPDAYIVVEKIHSQDEPLPHWPVHGTTGYDFIDRFEATYTSGRQESLDSMLDLQARFGGDRTPFPETAYQAKLLVVRAAFASEVQRLARLLQQVCSLRGIEVSLENAAEAVVQLSACHDGYRSYVRPGEPVDAATARHWNAAVRQAEARSPDIDPRIYGVAGEVMTLAVPEEAASEFALRMQQLTGPVAAKGVEDTALYRYTRLLSRNEPGSDPGRQSSDPSDFHAFTSAAARLRPHTMLATSTHDTKRSEDVRARIGLLSQIPRQWRSTVLRWSDHNRRHKQNNLPDPRTEYYLYQTLVGAYPIEVERIQAHMLKAAREAKLNTSWIEPRAAYEAALSRFVTGAMSDGEFMTDLEGFVVELRDAAYGVSLAATLIKLTAPGVPDIYQGCEVWQRTLVDPDNRGSVDYEMRLKLLENVVRMDASDAWKERESGALKVFVIQRVLQLRRERPELFATDATYAGLPVGPSGEALAFSRGAEMVTVARRACAPGVAFGEDRLQLPAGTWHDQLGGMQWSGGTQRTGDVLSTLPVALLVRT